jgi:hypothetical protein
MTQTGPRASERARQQDKVPRACASAEFACPWESSSDKVRPSLTRICLDLFTTFVALVAGDCAGGAQEPQEPNVVFILADNVGYGDLWRRCTHCR